MLKIELLNTKDIKVHNFYGYVYVGSVLMAVIGSNIKRFLVEDSNIRFLIED